MEGDPCSPNDRGREIASEIGACHWEIEITRKFDQRSTCEDVAESNGLEKIERGRNERFTPFLTLTSTATGIAY